MYTRFPGFCLTTLPILEHPVEFPEAVLQVQYNQLLLPVFSARGFQVSLLHSVNVLLKTMVPNWDIIFRGDVMCTESPRRPLTVCDVDTVLLSMQTKILSPSFTVGSWQSCLWGKTWTLPHVSQVVLGLNPDSASYLPVWSRATFHICEMKIIAD